MDTVASDFNPNQTITSEVPKPPHKQSWLWVVIAMVLLALLGLLAFLIIDNQSLRKDLAQTEATPTPPRLAEVIDEGGSPSITPDPTTDWQTYSNDKFNFEFKYPSTWVSKTVSVPGFDDRIWIATTDSRLPTTLPGQIGNGAAPPINIIISKKDMSTDYQPEQFNNFQSDTYQLGNINGIRISGFNKEGLSQETIISAKWGNWYINIIPLEVDEKLYLDQILSTFKFTGQNDSSTTTTGWPTYSSATANFKVNYPTNWRVVEFPTGVGFGPQEIGEDVAWSLNYYDKNTKTIQQIKSEIGDQFPDRQQTEEAITIHGLAATKVITTTKEIPDWYAVTIIFDVGNKHYVISNGAMRDIALNQFISQRANRQSNVNFEDFYSSFQPAK